MAGPAMTYSMVDYADVQGPVSFGYGHMTSASYALVRVKNKAAAKAWLRSAPITTAVAPMALASPRLTGTSIGKRHVHNWNTPILSRWASSCSAIPMSTEKLLIGLYWSRTRRTRNYCQLWILLRKKIWGATGHI